jgi:signal transduction histidine kinase
MANPHLRIDAHVVIQLGAELISDSEQALLELVKNAYDGDATKCRILIEPDWEPEITHAWKKELEAIAALDPKSRIGRIVVKDNGTGLSPKVVEEGWLFISASTKRATEGSKKKTPLGRIPVGDKGLGRLATMRLGDVLMLRTITLNEVKSRTTSFAWSSFNNGESLEKITVKTATQPAFQNRKSGTDIEILGLAEPGYWDSEANITSVVNKLSTLISPFDKFRDFRVEIHYNDQIRDLQAISAEALNFSSSKFQFSYKNGRLELTTWIAPSLFRGNTPADKAMYEELLADSNKEKIVRYFQNHKRLKDKGLVSMLKQPGGWLFRLTQSIDWDDIPTDPTLPGARDPGPYEGEIYYFLFNESTKKQFAAAQIPLELLKNATTIGMFRDRFRVRMDDDWLGLAAGQTSGNFFQLRPKNVVGYFAINNEQNANLVEKSDREGFVDNEYWRGFLILANRTKKLANDSLDSVRTAYDQLKGEVKRGISEKQENESPERSRAAMHEHADMANKTLMHARNSSSTLSSKIIGLQSLLSASPNSETNNRVDPRVASQLNAVVRDIQNMEFTLTSLQESTKQGFNAALQLGASNENLMEHNLRLIDAAAVGLSARSLAHEISSYLLQIEKAVATINRATKALQDDRIKKSIDSFSGAIREIKKVVATINPLIGGSRSLKENFYVIDEIKEFFELRDSRLTNIGIEISDLEPRGLRIRFSKARFFQILENLLQNSLYWLQEHSLANPATGKQICVEVDSTGITWFDSAKGVLQSIENEIFDAYVTEKPTSKGQGLGLFIVTAFLESEKCQIILLQDRNKYKRRFKFRIDLQGAIVL